MLLSSYRVDAASTSTQPDRVVLLHRWAPMPANDFFAFLGETVLSARDSELLAWPAFGKLGGADATPWTVVARLKGVRDITRLAVSPDGRWLAFVAEPASP